MRTMWILLVAAWAGSWVSTARAHELWLHACPGSDAGLIRLTFGDGPDLSEAERVAEIASAKVWAGVKRLEVKRLPDGLEAHVPAGNSAVVSAVADRGVVSYKGQSFVIYLAAYSQTRAIEPDQAANLGLGDDQVRLLLFASHDGPPVVRATWKAKPVADTAVKIFHGTGEPTEVRTNAHGEIFAKGRGRCWCRSSTRPKASATAVSTRKSASRPRWRSARRPPMGPR
jgi:hypothetical protein